MEFPPFFIKLDSLDSNYAFKYDFKGEKTIPIWDFEAKNRYNYQEFEVFVQKSESSSGNNIAKEEIKTKTNVDDEAMNINDYQKYRCPMCNLEVPTVYRREHINSQRHKINISIANLILERIKSDITKENDDCGDKKPLNAYFCESCAIIVPDDDGENHKSSKQHFRSLLQDRYLEYLHNMYSENDYLDKVDLNYLFTKDDVRNDNKASVDTVADDDNNDDDDVEVEYLIPSETKIYKEPEKKNKIDKEPEKKPRIRNRNKGPSLAVNNQVRVRRPVQIEGNITTETMIDLKCLSYDMRVAKYHDLLTNNTNDYPYEFTFVGFERVNIVTGDKIKIHVSFDNFNGLDTVSAPVVHTRCRICCILLDQLKYEHIFTAGHVEKMRIPLSNLHCFRKVCTFRMHCVLCNQNFCSSDIEDHKSKLTHHSALMAATSSADKEIAAAIKITGITPCVPCNRMLKESEYNAHIRSKKHKRLVAANKVVASRTLTPQIKINTNISDNNSVAGPKNELSNYISNETVSNATTSQNTAQVAAKNEKTEAPEHSTDVHNSNEASSVLVPDTSKIASNIETVSDTAHISQSERDETNATCQNTSKIALKKINPSVSKETIDLHFSTDGLIGRAIAENNDIITTGRTSANRLAINETSDNAFQSSTRSTPVDSAESASSNTSSISAKKSASNVTYSHDFFPFVKTTRVTTNTQSIPSENASTKNSFTQTFFPSFATTQVATNAESIHSDDDFPAIGNPTANSSTWPRQASLNVSCMPNTSQDETRPRNVPTNNNSYTISYSHAAGNNSIKPACSNSFAIEKTSFPALTHEESDCDSNDSFPDLQDVASHSNVHKVTPKYVPGKTYCLWCDIHIDSLNYQSHVGGQLHQVNLEIASGKFKTTTDNLFHYDPATDPLHYHYKLLDNNMVKCYVCKTEVPNHINNLPQHLNGAIHKKNYTALLKENQISHINKFTLKCKLCLITFPLKTELAHLIKPKHRALLPKTIQIPEYKCKVCDVSVPFTSEDLIKHEETHEHKKRVACYGTSNDEVSEIHHHYEKTKFVGSLKCLVCDCYIAAEMKTAHLESKAHVMNHNAVLVENELKNDCANCPKYWCGFCDQYFEYDEEFNHVNSFFHELQRMLRVSSQDASTQYFCAKCNVNIPNTARNISDHLKGNRHQSVLKLLSEKDENEACLVLTNQIGVWLCVVCEVNLPSKGKNAVNDHLNGKQHQKKLSVLFTKEVP